MTAPVAIAMTTSHRPHLLRGLVENIRAVTREPYRLLFMGDDRESERILNELGVENYRTRDTTFVEKVNALAELTEEPLFYWGADDTEFTVGWLDEALGQMDQANGIVALNDGEGRYDTALMSREYVELGTIDEPGKVFHPGYRHYFCEVEAYHTAIHRGRLAYAPNAVVRHNHWRRKRAPFDETYRRALAWRRDDERLFHSRAHLWGGANYHAGRYRPGSEKP